MNTIFLMPVNLYGPGDNLDLYSGHVIPALIRQEVRDSDNAIAQIRPVRCVRGCSGHPPSSVAKFWRWRL